MTMQHTDDALLIKRIQALTSPLTPQPTGVTPRLDPLPGIRAVLFDVYGTLVISGSGDIGVATAAGTGKRFHEAWIAAGFAPALLPTDFDGTAALTALIRAHHARSRDRGVDHPEVDIIPIWRVLLANLLGVPTTIAQLRRLALEYELRVNPVWPMPGLTGLIQTLRRRGLVLGVVSNAQFYTPLMLEAFLGQSLEAAGFDPLCCAWSYRHGVAKPSTVIYVPALAGLHQHHGIHPEQVLYIGNDLRNDIHPACALGCHTVLYAGDQRSLRLRPDDPQLGTVTPERVITTLYQLSSNLVVHY
jgi:putative hydrolase of the HAD superfamily